MKLLTMSFVSSLNCPSAIQRLQILRVQEFKSCAKAEQKDMFFAVKNCPQESWDISCKIIDGSNYNYVRCALEARRYTWLCKTGVKKHLFCCDPVCPN